MTKENGLITVELRVRCLCGHAESRHEGGPCKGDKKAEENQDEKERSCLCDKFQPAEKLVTKFRRCVSRLELSAIGSMLGELLQARESYVMLRKRYEADAKNEDLDPPKRNAAFEGLVDLDARFTGRTIPLANKLLGELAKRAAEGTAPATEYGLEEVFEAATQFVAFHKLSEQEAKNLFSGPGSSSGTRPQPTAPSAPNGSSTPKPEKKSGSEDPTTSSPASTGAAPAGARTSSP